MSSAVEESVVKKNEEEGKKKGGDYNGESMESVHSIRRTELAFRGSLCKIYWFDNVRRRTS